MFKFLKDKLKSAISKISEGVEKEGKAEEKIVEKPAEETEVKEKKGFFASIKERIIGKEEKPISEEKENQFIEKKEEVKIHEHEKYPLKEIKKETKPSHDEHKKEEKPQYKKTETNDEIKPIPKKTEDRPHHHPEFKETIKKIEPKILSKETSKSPEHKTEIKKEGIKIQEEHKIIAEEEPRKLVEEKPEKKGFFASLKEKIITTKISEEQFNNLFWELELGLMENNVAMEVIEKIKSDLKEELVEKPIKRGRVEETVALSLKNSIESLFESSNFNLIEEIKNKAEKPYVIAFFGINGSGKTTSIAKLANMLKEKNISCVLAAGDTFRAASIEQLQLHADKIGVKLIRHNYGSDPAAVAFDAIKHAKSKNIDAVLIDTAGRMHSNANLIDEMKKIIRVAKPNLKIFVGESITGNDCVEQAKTFNEAVGIDGIILAKADIDEKGGAAVSVSYITKKPILFLGVGQEYSDLKEFDSGIIMENLGLS